MERTVIDLATGNKTIVPYTPAEVAEARAQAAEETIKRAKELPASIKAECQRRIYAVVDQIAQVNLAAAAAGGVLTSDQMTVYRAGLAWIASMRAVCGQLVTNKDEAFKDDRPWPDPDPTIIALADQF